MNPYSSFLYAQPSAMEGVGRLVDFAGALDTYNISDSPAEADERALAADTLAVNEDLRDAARRVISQLRQELAALSRDDAA